MTLLLGILLSFIAAAVPALLYTWLVWWCDRYEREPRSLLILTFVWGAAPAVALSLVAEMVFNLPLALLPSRAAQNIVAAGAIAPIVEETVKGAILLALFLLAYQEFDGVLDGIVYGALVGCGFALSENFFYFLSALIDNGWGAWGGVVFLRAIVFGLNHAFFTSLTGIGLGVARGARQPWLRVAAPLIALGAAIFFHAVHNLGASFTAFTPLTLGISLLADWGGILIVGAVILLAWRQEQRWMLHYLPDEVPLEAVHAAIDGRLWEHVPIAATVRRRWQPAQRRAYQQLLAELAQRKHRLATLGEEAGLNEEVARLRARLRAMQGETIDA